MFNAFETADTSAAVPIVGGAVAGAALMLFLMHKGEKKQLSGLSGYRGRSRSGRRCMRYRRTRSGRRCAKYG